MDRSSQFEAARRRPERRRRFWPARQAGRNSPRELGSALWSLQTWLLALVTATLVTFALLNVRQLWVYRQPTDAALWQPTTAGLEAAAVATVPGGQPLRVGDRLVAINGVAVDSPEAVAQQVYAAGIGRQLDYAVVRGHQFLSIPVRVRAAQPALGRYAFLEIVGLLYLAVGLFVLDRRRRAPQALRFYLFCLASFVLYCFHFTGKLNAFDQIIFWGNEAALLLAPCLLADFALRFRNRPAPAGRLRAHLAWLLYVPAAVLGLIEVALATGAVWLPTSLSTSQAVLDRASYLLLAIYFLTALFLFARPSRDRVLARQARVMTWGTALAIGPFLVLYVIPYLLGADLPRWASASVLPLVLVPVAFGYAIWRHHLLEAEVVLRRGVVYTLATALVVVAYLGVLGLAGALIHARLPAWGVYGWLLAIVVTALLFDPAKQWLQERVDRLFYRERYDYRRTLIEFGRQMSAETSLERIQTLVLERLQQTLSLARAAVFLATDEDYVLGRGTGLPEAEPGRTLAFLRGRFDEAPGGATAGTWIVEQPTGDVAAWGLHYYLPCRLQGRVVAVLGLGRTQRGEFLSGEDLELVEALAGYLAIAIGNARLYARLQQKVDEYERLKEFSENIVESVHVGVIAVGLDGRVESWNAQMETLTARPRQQALGLAVTELLGTDFAVEFEQAVAGGGIWNRSKFRLPSGFSRRSGALGPEEPAPAASEECIVNLAIAPLLTARFERVGYIVLLSDVTAEARLEQQLIEADRLRSVGLLAAGVAHEVNTPLAVISSYAQMLAKQTPAGDPQAAVLATITRQTFRASEIIANLLNFSRLGAARFCQVELNGVVRDALALVEHPLRSAGIHVICALPPRDLPVLGDAGKLQQVLLNLILNARDAMPQGGTLRVSSGIRGDQAWISVSDTGHGISSRVRQRIFDPFFTTKAGLRRGSGAAPARPGATMSTGTGLGLAVTYGIIQEHGGAIHVESTPGRGSEFLVELPCCAPEPAPAEPALV